MATQRNIEIVIIHESASPHGKETTAADINDWHLENDWAGIGYHYVIDEHGDVEPGRPEYWTGSHAKGYNMGSLGICIIGQDGNFNEYQWDALYRLCLELKRRHKGVKFYGHRDFNPHKTCPGFEVKSWAKSIGLQ